MKKAGMIGITNLFFHLRRLERVACPAFPKETLGGIMKRMLMIVIGFICATVLCLSSSAYAGKSDNSAAEDLLIKSEVETAVSMLQAIYAKHRKGEMTLAQAKKLGADLLRELRYGTHGYFFADTMEGVNVVLYGRKDVEGQNILENRDANGTYYIKELLAKAKAGGGYVEYWYAKKGQTKAEPKRSYILLFKPFQWAVGTGYYR
jgi:signal transduction histidine kinase